MQICVPISIREFLTKRITFIRFGGCLFVCLPFGFSFQILRSIKFPTIDRKIDRNNAFVYLLKNYIWVFAAFESEIATRFDRQKDVINFKRFILYISAKPKIN